MRTERSGLSRLVANAPPSVLRRRIGTKCPASPVRESGRPQMMKRSAAREKRTAVASPGWWLPGGLEAAGGLVPGSPVTDGIWG